MITDNITTVACMVLITMAVITPFINTFFRRPSQKDVPAESDNSGLPQISVVIPAHDNVEDLYKNLHLLLEQDYPEGFEVIVVVSKTTGDNTDDILKQYSKYKNLYITFIPDSSRYMSRRKLAITVGIKAAKNDWILLTDAECRPNTNKWLETMARNCNERNNMVIGYCNYDDDSRQYQRFERLYDEMYLLREAGKGTAYRTSGGNLMFRKNEFMRRKGFEGNLKYIRGEYDFLVNKYAVKGCTAIETSPKAWVTEKAPSRKTWRNKHLYYMETRKHLLRSIRHRLLHTAGTTAMHLNYLLIIVYAILSILTERWIITIATAAALIITVTLRTIIGKKAVNIFNANIPAWKIVPFEISMLWRHLYYIIRYKMANKYDFICHKL